MYHPKDNMTVNEAILMELNGAVKALHFYPSGHPNLEEIIENLHSAVSGILDSHGEISLSVDKSGFLEHRKRIAQNKGWANSLAHDFFKRHIKKITFLPTISKDDIEKFLSAMREEPEEVLVKGPMGKQMSDSGISGIIVEDILYDEVYKSAEDIESKKDEEIEEEENIEIELELDEEEINPVEEEMPECNPEDALTDHSEMNHQGKTFSQLLNELSHENEAKRYASLLEAISLTINEHDTNSKMILVFSLLEILVSHIKEEEGKPHEIVSHARETIIKFLSDDFIIYIAGILKKGLGERKHSAEQIMVMSGIRGIDIMLDTFITSKEHFAKHRLEDTIMMFGEDGRNKIEERIESDDWETRRDMAYLLGNIGNPSSVVALSGLIFDPFPEVRAETIRALSKIPCEETSGILLKILDNEEKTDLLTTITALGKLKESAAVSPLIKIISQKDLFNENIEIRKESIKSLGLIGDKETVPALAGILSHKTWLGWKESNEIQASAIIALGKIGGREAYEAVERASSSANKTIRHICKKVQGEIKSRNE